MKQITSSDPLNLDGVLDGNKNLYAKVQFTFSSNETGKTFTVAYDKDGISNWCHNGVLEQLMVL